MSTPSGEAWPLSVVALFVVVVVVVVLAEALLGEDESGVGAPESVVELVGAAELDDDEYDDDEDDRSEGEARSSFPTTSCVPDLRRSRKRDTDCIFWFVRGEEESPV